jgi:hypothetical protein
MKIYRTSATAVFALLTAALALRAPHPAVAQHREGDSLTVRVGVADDSFLALSGRPVMVSVIREGQVVAQKESNLNSTAGFAVSPGLYDVRMEGDGMVTLVKRGIHVFDNQTMQAIEGPMRAGLGAHIVEYAPGGLSREEVAARIAKLEAEVVALRKGH